MAKKYYAVKNGRDTGIFTDWEKCRGSVDGFPGAEYKSFTTKKEAEAYLGSEQVPDKLPDFGEKALIAYVDGSYDVKTCRYAFGCVLIRPDGGIVTKNGTGEEENARTARNVAGELLATMYAVTWAVKNGFEQVHIYHDYDGICMWYEKKWKAESYCATEYMKYMERFRGKIDIIFHKVAAHTGVTYNEMADSLAKEALGLK